MTYNVSRILSLGVAAIYLLAIATNGESLDDGLLLCLRAAPVLAFPLGLIWFPEVISRFDADERWGRDLTEAAPGVMFVIMGWLMLVGVPLLMVVLTW